MLLLFSFVEYLILFSEVCYGKMFKVIIVETNRFLKLYIFTSFIYIPHVDVNNSSCVYR